MFEVLSIAVGLICLGDGVRSSVDDYRAMFELDYSIGWGCYFDRSWFDLDW